MTVKQWCGWQLLCKSKNQHPRQWKDLGVSLPSTSPAALGSGGWERSSLPFSLCLSCFPFSGVCVCVSASLMAIHPLSVSFRQVLPKAFPLPSFSLPTLSLSQPLKPVCQAQPSPGGGTPSSHGHCLLLLHPECNPCSPGPIRGEAMSSLRHLGVCFL